MSADTVKAARIPLPFASASPPSARSKLLSVVLAALVCSACAQTPAADRTTRVTIQFLDTLPADHPDLLRSLAERTGCGIDPVASVAGNVHAYRLVCPPDAGDFACVLEKLATAPGVVAVTPDMMKTHPRQEPER